MLGLVKKSDLFAKLRLFAGKKFMKINFRKKIPGKKFRKKITVKKFRQISMAGKIPGVKIFVEGNNPKGIPPKCGIPQNSGPF